MSVMSNHKFDVLSEFPDIASTNSSVVNTTSERCILWIAGK